MKADLHLHSTYSDGKYTPDEICQRAKSRGISLLSITDHDTLLGLEEKQAAAKRHGLWYIGGWEISAYEGEEKIHILGYGCGINEEYFRFTEKRAQASFARAEDSVKKCNRAGIPLTMEDVLAQIMQSGAPVHTMHVARALTRYVEGAEGEIYLRYLAKGKLANSNLGRPTPQEAIEVIHALGGVASLAHLGRIPLPKERREALVRRLVKAGLDGIEGVYTTHTARETEFFHTLASRYGLFLSGGSDTHVEDGTHTIGKPDFYAQGRLLSLAISPSL